MRVEVGGSGDDETFLQLLMTAQEGRKITESRSLAEASQRGVDRGSRHQAPLPVAQAADPHLLSRNWLYWDRQPTVVRWTFVQFVQRAPRFGK